jgi:TonB family protein
MAKKLRSSFFRSLLLHLGLLLLVSVLVYHPHEDPGPVTPITIETISLGREVKKAIHSVVHSMGLPHQEPVEDSPSSDHSSSQDSGPASLESSESSGALASEIQRYLGEVISRIDSKKRYPKAAQFNEQEGLVQVLLEVSGQGVILRTELEKASPFPLLNEAALDAVRAIGTLPPLPVSYSSKSIVLHVPIHFRIER